VEQTIRRSIDMTDHYAVIGNPVAHSKSPQIHAAFAAETGEDIDFSRLLAPLDGFRRSVDEFLAGNGRGLSVTLPFKLEALQLAARATERARLAGAANCLKLDDAGWHADNTDGAGLLTDLIDNLGFDPGGKRVLLIGAGGAARGILRPLLEAHPVLLHVANRTRQTAVELAQACAPNAGGKVTAGDIASAAAGRFDLVINATSASLRGDDLALPAGLYAEGSLAYDLVYARDSTPFMQLALSQGAARVADGLGMLVEQAAESFFLWRGLRPATAPVLAMLRNTL
jgi:shikimate dehydrogenase